MTLYAKWTVEITLLDVIRSETGVAMYKEVYLLYEYWGFLSSLVL